MRQVIMAMSVTVDGFGVGPNDDMNWVTDNFDPEMGQYIGEGLASMGAILLGGNTYRIWAQAWPHATGPFADLINAKPKIVFSRSMTHSDWGNSTFINRDIAAEVQKLKSQPGAPLMLQGGPGIANEFIRLGLVDAYHLFVVPVVLGQGKPLFGSLPSKSELKLTNSKKYNNGVMLLEYETVVKSQPNE